MAETCEIRKRDDDVPADKFPVPEIITHEPRTRIEFYEVKPNNQYGKNKGRIKIQSFQAMSDFFRQTATMVNYKRGTLFDPDRFRVLWDGTWFGSPVKVFLHFFREEESLIVYEVCVEVSGQLLAEDFVKDLIKMAVMLTILALITPAPAVAAVLAWNSPLEDAVGSGGANGVQDTRYLQALLNDWRPRNGRAAIAVDGQVGIETIGTIEDFQEVRTGIVDRRIDPGGPALAALERSHVDDAAEGIQLTEMQELGTEGLALALVRPDPDALVEGVIETDPVTASNEAIQQYFDELHAEV